uniref:Uncharacterized plasmid pDG1 103 kDa protein n=1 Tax=Dictyostelium sp. (strain GA11) TaxID=5785 RepID=YPG1_DICSP|nr:RecName: Full=Uncharacterized plasmid pDG1 103 kDa protein [Dictyostelium sp. (STRAIN GA11)]CAA31988.1 unnamed protein product [Dictyostelium sp.]
MQNLAPWESFFMFVNILLRDYEPVKRRQQGSESNEVMKYSFTVDTLICRELFRSILKEKTLGILGDYLNRECIFERTKKLVKLNYNDDEYDYDLDDILKIRKNSSGKLIVDDIDQAIFIIDHLSRKVDCKVFTKKSLVGFRHIEKTITEAGYKIRERRSIGLDWYTLLNDIRTSCAKHRTFVAFSKYRYVDFIAMLTAFHQVKAAKSNEEEHLSTIYSLYPFVEHNFDEDKEDAATTKQTTTTTTTTPQTRTRKRQATGDNTPTPTPAPAPKPTTPKPTPAPRKISSRKNGGLTNVRVDHISVNNIPTPSDTNESLSPPSTIISSSNSIKQCLVEVLESKGEISIDKIKSIFNCLQNKQYTGDLIDSMFQQNKSEKVITISSKLFNMSNKVDYDEINFAKLKDDILYLSRRLIYEKNTNLLIPTEEGEGIIGFLWLPVVNGALTASVYVSQLGADVDFKKISATVRFVQLCISMSDIIGFMELRSLSLDAFRSIANELLYMSDRILNLEADLRTLKDIVMKPTNLKKHVNVDNLFSRLSPEGSNGFANYLYDFISNHPYIKIDKSQNSIKLKETPNPVLVLTYDPKVVEHKVGFLFHCRSEISRFNAGGNKFILNNIQHSFTPNNIGVLSQDRENDLKRNYSMLTSNTSKLITGTGSGEHNLERFISITINNTAYDLIRVVLFRDISNGISISNLRDIFRENSDNRNRYLEYLGKSRLIRVFFIAPCLIQILEVNFAATQLTADKNFNRAIKSIKIRNLSYITIDIIVGGNVIDSIRGDATQVVQINASEFSFSVSCLKFSVSATLVSKKNLQNISTIVLNKYNEEKSYLQCVKKFSKLSKSFIRKFTGMNININALEELLLSEAGAYEDDDDDEGEGNEDDEDNDENEDEDEGEGEGDSSEDEDE